MTSNSISTATLALDNERGQVTTSIVGGYTELPTFDGGAYGVTTKWIKGE